MTDEPRRIELEIEVEGSPEEVWRAIATGPGISSWFVPSTIQEQDGGTITQNFGPGMAVSGVVTGWEPPLRFAYGSADGQGLACEWLVQARDGGSCVVRLVSSGFGEGEEWDQQYDAMTDGWRIFLANLQVRQRLFPGQTATPIGEMTVWPGDGEPAWRRFTRALGMPDQLAPGDAVATSGSAPELAGRVAASQTGHHVVLELREPAPGTAFLATEAMGDNVAVSVWLFLYGDDAPEVAEREHPRWQKWLTSEG